MRGRLLRLTLAVAVVLVLAGSVVDTAVDFEGPEALPFAFGFILLGVGAATAGAFVVTRVPGNTVGPILLGMGLGVGLMMASGAYAETSARTYLGPLPGDAYAAWLSAWLTLPVFFGLTAFLLLLFPTGQLLTPRWRWAAWCVGIGVSLATAAEMFSPEVYATQEFSLGLDNPVGATGRAAGLVRVLADVTDLMALPIMLLAAAALMTRLWRSRGVERQQLKSFTFAAALVWVGLGLPVTLLPGGILADAAFLVGLLALAALPIVAGVAIVRHGLYDIDVVIHRTLVYAVLTATLVATYLVSVLMIRVLVSPVTGDSNLAVAGSTLAVAGLFRPARARIQHAVDRRFYRARYDAARTLEGFAARLRDQLDIDALAADLRLVVVDTMQPTHASLWLKEVAR